MDSDEPAAAAPAPAVAATPPEPEPEPPSDDEEEPAGMHPAATFSDWYLSKAAGCFGDEIEALQHADAPVHPKVLLQAFAAGVALFTPQEQAAAVAADHV